ncbi:PREDICTED: coiled-coil domain-containing protein 27 isoform X1 [Crocodylus porosus]|uniref:coiled-coil domain-containing protein 27 isoform X1 n=2 Tax=Crocodylus porosus TaxID=8502 RepID=UPI00093EBD8B|nr:PREDICTED: coiled-coil domain-containing protein 27 isoform X1 [Crocodylus porosus]
MNLLAKGLGELQELSSRRQQSPVWKLPRGRSALSKSAQAIQRYYDSQADIRAIGSFESEYKPQMEELQRSFLLRPGCPRLCNKATSTSQLESNLPEIDISNRSSTSSSCCLSPQLSFEEWKSAFLNTQLPANTDPVLQPKWKNFSAVPPVIQLEEPSSSKVPWYIDVIREKEECLLMLEEEVNHLSKCEAECARKDSVISDLGEEVESLTKQLDMLRQSSILGAQTDAAAPPALRGIRSQKLRLSSTVQGSFAPSNLREEVACLQIKLNHSDRLLGSKISSLSQALMKDHEELEQLEKEYSEIQQNGLRQEASEEEIPGEMEGDEALEEEVKLEEEVEAADEAAAEEQEALTKLQELQRVNQELREELEKVKTAYDMATGAVSSLQRQLDFQQSQLCKVESEKAMLQKELRERGAQLQAMSAKFSSLREDRKHEELMGTIEQENYKLRQDVEEQESRLAKNTRLLEELQGTVSRLQAELAVSQRHLQQQQGKRQEAQSHVEALQRAEQQTRVALECMHARFERFRSKIIQATHSTAGSKSPQAEIGDDEVLEVLQRIITERLEFHHILRQKGLKVPSLHNTDLAMSPILNSKSNRKSPVK